MTGKLPSVTQVLAEVGLGPDFSRVPREVIEWASLRGTAVHAAIKYHHEGELDESAMHESWAGGFRAYLRFVEETQHVPIASEPEIVHPAWHYVGHPDRIGWHQGATRVIIDWKYTAGFDDDYVRLQLAGYRLAWNATHPMEPVEKAFGLHLRRDETYRLHDLTDALAEQEFLAALLVYRARARRRRSP